jgi:hypothetical protein
LGLRDQRAAGIHAELLTTHLPDQDGLTLNYLHDERIWEAARDAGLGNGGQPSNPGFVLLNISQKDVFALQVQRRNACQNLRIFGALNRHMLDA